MPLHCPFCNAEEDDRLEAVDSKGNKVLLVMFGCPFYYHFREGEFSTDGQRQASLDRWRVEKGEEWLNSLGPVMKTREMRNIERSRSSKLAAG